LELKSVNANLPAAAGGLQGAIQENGGPGIAATQILNGIAPAVVVQQLRT
jgi:hypothetical protein